MAKYALNATSSFDVMIFLNNCAASGLKVHDFYDAQFDWLDGETSMEFKSPCAIESLQSAAPDGMVIEELP